MKPILALTCCILSLSIYGQTYTVDSVPNEKLRTGSYVSNPDGILSSSTVKEIDQILGSLEQASTAQVAVVVLNAIDSDDHIDFAQRLFEKWGIGQADNDNGLLVLFIMNPHNVRLHTGYGVEGILTDAVCKRIEMEYMVPYFKEGKYDEGMIAGVQRAAELLNNPELVSEESNRRGTAHVTGAFYFFVPFMWSGIMMIPFLFLQLSNGFRGQGKKKRTDVDVRMSRKEWALAHLVLPLTLLLGCVFVFGVDNGWLYLGLLIGFILILLFAKYERIKKAGNILYKEAEYTRIYNLYRDYQTAFVVFAFLLPIPMAFFYLYYNSRKKFYRNHPRPCTQCNATMVKLDEKTDDDFLEEAEIFEEKLGSVDYDIWHCPNCKSARKITFTSRSTKYSDCPSCKTRAFYVKSRRTIVHATTSSTGTGEETKECKFCHHQTVRPYTIPKVSRSSSSSGGGGGGSSSWGGGSSGGGGSSSSW